VQEELKKSDEQAKGRQEAAQRAEAQRAELAGKLGRAEEACAAAKTSLGDGKTRLKALEEEFACMKVRGGGGAGAGGPLTAFRHPLTGGASAPATKEALASERKAVVETRQTMRGQQAELQDAQQGLEEQRQEATVRGGRLLRTPADGSRPGRGPR
jgi:hypothetical protein